MLGLPRTCRRSQADGKSCRLRWLNYLRPDVKHGDFTAQEQLRILELHSRWGNRWSKIAQQLPGRSDNEIKNYWRTRVQKHAKQINCDLHSKRFKDTIRYLWMPRLAERIHANTAATTIDDYGAGDACASRVTVPTTYMESSPASVITSSTTSSAGTFTATSEEKSQVINGVGAEDIDREFWSTDMQVQPSKQLIQFQDQDLSGWVQGLW